MGEDRASAGAFSAGLFWGLSLRPSDPSKAARDGTITLVAVTLFILVLDTLFFWHSPRTGYVAFYTSPLWPRTPLICLLALVEAVKFRLLLMSAIVAVGALLKVNARTSWMIGAILLSQLVNVAPLVVAAPLYASLRFWLVGCAWGWLYWRHGWTTAALSHTSCHLLLDPLLLIVLSAITTIT